MTNLSANVRVTFQVEVSVGNWTGSESFVSIQEVAVREATNKLQRVLKDTPGVRVVGQPAPIQVILIGGLTA